MFKPLHDQNLVKQQLQYKYWYCISFQWKFTIVTFLWYYISFQWKFTIVAFLWLTHLFPMHPFSTPWRHQKTFCNRAKTQTKNSIYPKNDSKKQSRLQLVRDIFDLWYFNIISLASLWKYNTTALKFQITLIICSYYSFMAWFYQTSPNSWIFLIFLFRVSKSDKPPNKN